jgi:sugar PTS system EIIA component
MHIGIGTVSMNGRGFVRFVQAGDEVKAGDPLIAFDDQRILDAGYKDTVVVMVTNADELGLSPTRSTSL